jgi:DNA mismatch repair protein MutS
MALSDIAMRDLEIFETSRRRQSEGSLFRTINGTLTPMGGRLLRWSFSHPFTNQKNIRIRHDAVDCLLREGETKLLSLRSKLKVTADLSRIATRVQSRRASPLELGKIRQTLSGLLNLEIDFPSQSPVFKMISHSILKTRPAFDVLDSFLKDEPGLLGQGYEVFKPGFDSLLDEKVSLARGGEGAIQDYEEKLKLETGITSLKIKSHQSFGLLIEVTKSHLSKVPNHFVRRQTMVNCERFVTMDLKELDETLASAKDEAVARESVLFETILSQLTSFLPEIYALSDAIGELDLIQGFAWQALKQNFVRPTFVPEKGLLLAGSRHPVIEHLLGRSKYVPNDIELSPEKKLLLITGPNMAGKSTVMRKVAVSALLSQMGSFVPAVKANLPVFDQIFTRVGASDDLASGQSTFMVEMNEASLILRQATANSLVILDEVGRGTSTQDGLAIASAILEDIASRLTSWCLFATHYHELVPVAEQMPGVKLVKTEVEQTSTGIQFTHRLVNGASESSFGIEVAKLAGVPEHVLQNAKLYLSKASESEFQTNFELSRNDSVPSSKLPSKKMGEAISTNTSFTQQKDKEQDESISELISKLESLNLNRMTPLQALNQLSELKDMLRIQNQPKPRGLFDMPAH